MHYNKKINKGISKMTYLFAIVLLIVFSAASLVFINNKSIHKHLLLKCYGNALTIREDSNETESKINTTSSIFLYSNGEGIFTQVGRLIVKNRTYAIDRVHKIDYSDSDNDGVYTMKMHNMVKRAGDNLPENIPVPYNLLHESPPLLYVNITEVGANLYLFKESHVPLFLCKKP